MIKFTHQLNGKTITKISHINQTLLIFFAYTVNHHIKEHKPHDSKRREETQKA